MVEDKILEVVCSQILFNPQYLVILCNNNSNSELLSLRKCLSLKSAFMGVCVCERESDSKF